MHQPQLRPVLEATAFDAHVLGRPKIERVQVTWSGDANTTLAQLIAGSVDYLGDNSIRVERGVGHGSPGS